MFKRIYLAWLVSFAAFLNATGQSTSVPNPVAFGMIRATTEFLATDTKAFGNRSIVPCSPCETYADLTQYVTKNRLLGADKLITDARSEANSALQTDSTQMPALLRSFLVSRVTGGTRSYRTDLPSYSQYLQSLDVITGTSTASIAPGDVPESGDLTPIVEPTDTTSFPAEPLPTASPDQLTNASIMDYLPIILSVLSLAGVIVLWFRKPAAPSQPMILPDDRLDKFENRVRELEKDNRQLKDSLIALRQTVDAPRPPVAPQQPANRNMAQTQMPAPDPVRPAPQPAPQKPAPLAPTAPQAVAPTVLFGRTADLGDGFSAHNLSDKPDRDTVFEILRIDPTRAEFKVSDNPDLQRLALSDAYSYLNDTCAYTTQPRPGNRIRTEKPGLLSLQGEKWAIVEKAQISFLG